MMLRQRASPPPQCRQELPGCHFLPQLLLFPASIEHSAVVQQTEPGINVAHTDQLSTDTVSALCSPGIAMLYYSLQGAVKQWFCGRVAGCYTEDGAGGTQRGPSPGQAHRTRGGSSIYFLFCPNHQPWTRKNTRKLCPGPSIMKRKTSMKPTATLEEKKLALIAESKEDNPFFFANLLFIKCFQCSHFFHLISKQLYFYGTRVELVSSYFH